MVKGSVLDIQNETEKRKEKIRCHVINNKRNDFKAKVVSKTTHTKNGKKKTRNSRSVSQ